MKQLIERVMSPLQCPNCHQLQQTPGKFCAHCGTALPQPPQPMTPGAAPGYGAQPAPPAYQAQPQVQGYAPAPQPHAPYGSQTWAPPPAAPARTLWGRPLHFWLIVASVIAVVALILPWYSNQVSGRVSWKETGYEYSDGTRSTWTVPEVTTSSYGGGNGLSVFTLALAGTIGGLALKFRSGAWPRWAGFTLAGVAGLVTFIGVINATFDPNIGPMLFAVAGGLAIPAAIQLLRPR